MEFLSASHTDVGLRKKTNQDSVLVKLAETDYGKVFFAVICDGMGGLAKGELASATLIKAFSEWFEQTFPKIFYQAVQNGGLGITDLQDSWDTVIQDTNDRLHAYSDDFHTSLGTTCVGLLLYKNQYYVFNVGDSRVYLINQSAKQITKDQTWVQREMDEGRMTEAEAKIHPQQNVLLQCVGASQIIIPDFYNDGFENGVVFMLCSDGFRHLITNDELYAGLNSGVLNNEKVMKDAAVYFTELNKQRNERDNISVILVRAD